MFCGLSFLLKAQNSTCTELKKWVDKITLLDEFEQDITYTIYKDHSSNEVLEIQCGKYIKNKNKVLLELFGNVMIQDEKYQVHINKDEKVIVVGDATDLPVSTFADIEKWTSLCNIITKMSPKNHLIGFSLQFKTSQIAELSKAEIWINTNTSMLEELVLYFNQDQNIAETWHNPKFVKPRLHIRYQTFFSKNNKITPIDYKEYLVISNGKIKPKPEFKDWQLNIVTTKM